MAASSSSGYNNPRSIARDKWTTPPPPRQHHSTTTNITNTTSATAPPPKGRAANPNDSLPPPTAPPLRCPCIADIFQIEFPSTPFCGKLLVAEISKLDKEE
ncbi:GD19094 [Drosophila simulans]|uniref:GD19094 n=1 Tax=Drosophila simulans TaxID=7240 RepID=B4QX39_DROSI|nr:GD19094 [Drosophila simulans]